MSVVDGESLAAKIAAARDGGGTCVELDPACAPGRASALRAASCVAAVARALQYAHDKDILHRDVKPSNILITPDGAPVLLDFGLAMGAESEASTLTRTGQTAGTPAYLAPELVSGERARHDARSDVYALGVALYECLSLRRPFDGPTQVALYRSIVSGTATDVRALNHDVSRDLAVVVATAMEREPARRYRSAAAFAADLEACAAGRPIVARRVPLSGRVVRWMRREPRQAVLAGSLLVVTLAAAVAAGSWWASRAEVRAAARLTNNEKLEKSLQLGFSSLATNWLEEPEQYFRDALELAPQNAEAYAGLVLLSMKRHREDEVAALLEHAPRTPAFRALAELAAGRVPQADQDALWLAEASPAELFVDGLRLKKQAETSPRDERAKLAQLALRRFNEAIVRLRTTRMLYHIERAFAARDAGDEEATRSAAAALALLWPDQERALFTAGNALNVFDPRAGLALLRRATVLDPNWGAPYQNIGNALLSLNDPYGAMEALQRAIELDPRDADAWNSLGSALFRTRCDDDARTAYLHALRIRPMWETWANLGKLDGLLGDLALAETELRQALRVVPRHPAVLLALAETVEKRGDFTSARDLREAASALAPRDAGVWSAFARSLIAHGENDAALAASEAGLLAAPEDEGLAALRDAALAALDARQ